MDWVQSTFRYILNRSVNRQRFNDTAIYAVYLAVRYPAHAKSKKAESEFYRQTFGKSLQLIFDVGASGGAKTAIFSKLANKVVSIESSPIAVDILKERFAHNSRVTIVAGGVGDHEGKARLNIFDGADAYNTFSDKWVDVLKESEPTPWRPNKIVTSIIDVPMTTLDSLIRSHGVPDYVKIDVEGYELQVIKGLSMAVPLVSFECHLPEFKDETTEIIHLLSDVSPGGLYNFTISEPPRRLNLPSWVGPAEMIGAIDSGQFGFMEIFFRSARDCAGIV